VLAVLAALDQSWSATLALGVLASLIGWRAALESGRAQAVLLEAQERVAGGIA
jgi:hypothetical protein